MQEYVLSSLCVHVTLSLDGSAEQPNLRGATSTSQTDRAMPRLRFTFSRRRSSAEGSPSVASTARAP